MIPWTPDIDPSTIPDSVLRSERARRNSALRKVHSGGKNGRPKKLVRCATCGEQFGTTEFRKHEKPCVQAWVKSRLDALEGDRSKAIELVDPDYYEMVKASGLRCRRVDLSDFKA